MLIGITGGMGSGKSTVARIIASEGYKVIDSDAISREVTAAGSPLLQKLSDYFGPEIIDEEGKLKRHVLADLAFGDEEKTETLNYLVQGAILQQSMQLKHEYDAEGEEYIFFDVPLLYESGWDRYCNEVILVTSPLMTRIHRIEDRDGLSFGSIMKRINLQMTDKEKFELCDYNILNNGSLDDLKERTLAVLNKILND